MARNIDPISVERFFDENKIIVSKTNVNSHMTYANQARKLGHKIMTAKTFNLSFKEFLICGAMAFTSFTMTPAQANDLETALIKEGNFFGQVRYRHEEVEQSGFMNDAKASTVRTNVGFKTGVYEGFQALIEGQIVQNMGANDFNDTVNGQTTFPIVADPDIAEINQLWLSYAGVPNTVIKIGRIAENLDNLRFVGTVGWRQNDQTFDMLSIANTSIEGLKLYYAHMGNVNRIQGNDHPSGDFDSNNHVVRASYNFTDWLKITGYGYWLDFDESAANSSKTYGMRLTGNVPLNEDWTFFYEAEGAKQSDHANNTANYDENYYHIAPGIKGYGFTLKAGYEELGGDGTDRFRTPLATLHKFNGWADAFLTTPTAGLEDTYISASYKISDTNSTFDGMKLTAVYHDFDNNDSGTGDFGDELDLSISKSFTLPDAGQPFKKVNVLLKYADYDGDNGVANREKVWLQIALPF